MLVDICHSLLETALSFHGLKSILTLCEQKMLARSSVKESFSIMLQGKRQLKVILLFSACIKLLQFFLTCRYCSTEQCRTFDD